MPAKCSVKPNSTTVYIESVVPHASEGIAPLAKDPSGLQYHVGESWLPVKFPEADYGALFSSQRRVKQGQALYRSGDPCGSVYRVRFGVVKSTALHLDGREQVLDFYMVGEMFGFDGIASGNHASDATAVTDSSVCAMPYEARPTLSQNAHVLYHRALYRMFSEEIVRKQRMMFLLGSMASIERLAAFLLNVSERLGARGCCASDFNVRMTRQEIGSLLGMTLETVSRILSKFQQAALIQIDGKQVRILSVEGLRGIVGRECLPVQPDYSHMLRSLAKAQA
jgi:CRP/FNR family transcriptional regulator